MLIFQLERNGNIVYHRINGFFCSSKYPNSIQISGTYQIQLNDILIHEGTNQRFLIDEIRPLTNSSSILHYQKWKEQPSVPMQNISIGTINGNAIVGSQENATIHAGMNLEEIISAINQMDNISDSEKRELEQLASTVDSISRNGLLGRCAPIIGAILQPITTWLLPK